MVLTRSRAPASRFLGLVSLAVLTALAGFPGRAQARSPDAGLPIVTEDLTVSYLLMGGETDPGAILAGRPVAWLALQLLGAAALVALMAAVPSLRRDALGTLAWQRVGAALVVLGAVAWVPWLVYWGLLRP